MAVAFRQHALLRLDDCLYPQQARIPHLTCSALHGSFQRPGISRLRVVEGEKTRNGPSGATRSATSTSTSPRCAPRRGRPASPSPWTELQGRLRPPQTQRHRPGRHGVPRQTCRRRALPDPRRLDGRRIQFADLHRNRDKPTALWRGHPFRSAWPPTASITGGPNPRIHGQRPSRANEPHPQGGQRPALPIQHRPAACTPPRRLPRRLQIRKAPQDLTRAHPLRAICKAWTDQPERFIRGPST